MNKCIWIGHPGIFPKSKAERLEIENILRPHNCYPVFIDEHTYQQGNIFHETVIFPLFHNFKSVNDDFNKSAH